ncbi:hypothetical protein BP6252_06152 [Coleophoma cylindrospora]|uniref:Carbohydrate-binding module family 18 protein n=1 Tax=Coleophoma cylindrospora TaxID=1849047 RepID=A0A3D8RM36_9HELO|nr:hypothetical protein BP6252_06152 [Coleophoma cylindrospora]
MSLFSIFFVAATLLGASSAHDGLSGFAEPEEACYAAGVEEIACMNSFFPTNTVLTIPSACTITVTSAPTSIVTCYTVTSMITPPPTRLPYIDVETRVVVPQPPVQTEIDYITVTVSSFETVCPSPTTFTWGTSTYTITAPATITVTDCPCVLTKPVIKTSPSPSASQSSDVVVYTTITTSEFTTELPSPTAPFITTYGTRSITVTDRTTITVIDCPCTLTRPVTPTIGPSGLSTAESPMPTCSSVMPPAPTPIGTIECCTEWYTVVEGATCATIELEFDITFAEFQALNHALDNSCSNLVLGYSYCVVGQIEICPGCPPCQGCPPLPASSSIVILPSLSGGSMSFDRPSLRTTGSIPSVTLLPRSSMPMTDFTPAISPSTSIPMPGSVLATTPVTSGLFVSGYGSVSSIPTGSVPAIPPAGSVTSMVPVASCSASITVPSNVAPETTGCCIEFYEALEGDSCTSIELRFNITLGEFQALNPGLNADCSNLLSHVSYCVHGQIEVCPGCSPCRGCPPLPSSFSVAILPMPSSSPNIMSAPSVPTTSVSPSGTVCTMTGAITSILGMGQPKASLYCSSYLSQLTPTSTFSLAESTVPIAYGTTTIGAMLTSGTGEANSPTAIPSCTAVPAPAETRAGATEHCCEWYIVVANDSCTSIDTRFGLTLAEFQDLNPDIFCDCYNLLQSFAYCVKGSPSSVKPSDACPAYMATSSATVLPSSPATGPYCGPLGQGYSCASACCSQHGYCGVGPEYCGTGCYPDYSGSGLCSQFSSSSVGIPSTTAKTAAPVSTSVGIAPNCGTQGNGVTCSAVLGGECCSEFGYCGTDNAHCGVGCQSLFGNCYSRSTSVSSSAPTATSIGIPPNCGTQGNGVTCSAALGGECCSEFGYCGTDNAHCGVGCQSLFGNCYPRSSSVSSSAPTATSIGIPPNCGPSANGAVCSAALGGECCSYYGYCGTGDAHCGAGCLSLYGQCSLSVFSSSSIIANTATPVFPTTTVRPAIATTTHTPSEISSACSCILDLPSATTNQIDPYSAITGSAIVPTATVSLPNCGSPGVCGVFSDHICGGSCADVGDSQGGICAADTDGVGWCISKYSMCGNVCSTNADCDSKVCLKDTCCKGGNTCLSPDNQSLCTNDMAARRLFAKREASYGTIFNDDIPVVGDTTLSDKARIV